VEAAGEVLSLLALLITGTKVQILTQKALQVRAAAAASRSADLTEKSLSVTLSVNFWGENFFAVKAH
jgi:hypothetical protein